MSRVFAYLSESDRELLRRLPFPVALPQTLPQGWSAQPLSIYEDEEPQEASVDAAFTGPGGATLNVMTSNGGIGDALPGEDSTSQMMKVGAFGSIPVYSYVEDETPEVLSDWFPDEESADYYHSFRGTRISDSDLSLLAASLQLCGSP